MPDAFVPFFVPDLKPKTEGKKEAFAAMGPAATSPHSGGAEPSGQHRPVVKLEREGDRVRKIRIECACGQVIELDCVY